MDLILPIGRVRRESALGRYNDELLDRGIRSNSIEHSAKHLHESLHHYELVVRIWVGDAQMFVSVIQGWLKPWTFATNAYARDGWKIVCVHEDYCLRAVLVPNID